jgi:hypothetical protein
MIYQGKTLTAVGTARIQRPEREYPVKTYAIAWSSKEKMKMIKHYLKTMDRGVEGMISIPTG